MKSTTTKTVKILRLVEEEKRDIKFDGALQENYKYCVKSKILLFSTIFYLSVKWTMKG